MKFNVITIGGVVRDVLFYTDQGELIKNSKNSLKQELLGFEFGAKIYSESVYFAVGGGAANTAASFAKLGFKVGLISQIGSDFNGDVVKNELNYKNINLSGLKIDSHSKTGFSFLVVDKKSGEHTVFAYRGAGDELEVTKADLGKNQSAWFYLASLSGKAWRKSLKNIFSVSKNIAWNPGSSQLKAGYRFLRPYINKTTIFNVNKDEALELALSKNKKFNAKATTKSLLSEIKTWGAEIVIITDGRQGSTAFDGKNYYYQATLKNLPVDTTGAGDCFGATFLAGYIKFNSDISKAMQFATVNASSLVSEIGAQVGLLSYSEVLKRMKKLL